jgi:hypothetical protein
MREILTNTLNNAKAFSAEEETKQRDLRGKKRRRELSGKNKAGRHNFFFITTKDDIQTYLKTLPDVVTGYRETQNEGIVTHGTTETYYRAQKEEELLVVSDEKQYRFRSFLSDRHRDRTLSVFDFKNNDILEISLEDERVAVKQSKMDAVNYIQWHETFDQVCAGNLIPPWLASGNALKNNN